MKDSPKVKESIGLYTANDKTSLVHVAKTPKGIEILNHQEGKLSDLVNFIKPAYERVYRKIGKPEEYFLDDSSDLNVVSVIPAQDAFPRNIKLPPLVSELMVRMIHYEAQQNVPFPIEEVAWGYHFNQKESSLFLLAAKKEKVDDHVRTLDDLGIKPTSVTTSTEALSCLIDNGVMIYPEENYHTIMIIQNGAYHTRSIPVGNDIPRLWPEISRSFNFYRSQINPSAGELGPLYQKGLNPELIAKLSEKLGLNDVRELEFIGFIGQWAFDGKSFSDYVALGAAISGANNREINLLRKVK